MAALTHCPECRETGQYPWQHRDDCTEALRQKVKLYEFALPWILLLLVAETLLLITALAWLGKLP